MFNSIFKLRLVEVSDILLLLYLYLLFWFVRKLAKNSYKIRIDWVGSKKFLAFMFCLKCFKIAARGLRSPIAEWFYHSLLKTLEKTSCELIVILNCTYVDSFVILFVLSFCKQISWFIVLLVLCLYYIIHF